MVAHPRGLHNIIRAWRQRQHYTSMDAPDTVPQWRECERVIWYRLPDPMASDRDYARLHHRDLPTLPPSELWAERTRVQVALAFEPHPWLMERLVAVNRELDERRRNRGTAAPAPVRPESPRQPSGGRRTVWLTPETRNAR